MTSSTDDIDVHRLLDEAFAGVEMTPERQDLKEEVRANLLARVAELRAEGLTGGAAARRAIADLGDIGSIVDTDGPAAVLQVRPRPGYVLRTVVLAAAGLAGLAVAGTGGPDPAALGVALVAGALTADALRQETTGNHPMPTGRALAYGGGVLLVVAALGCGWVALREGGTGWLVAGVAAVVAAAALLGHLGATQTNRHKRWVVRMAATHAAAGDRFTDDPVAAARFGVYTVVVWLLALAAFVLLTLTIGWLYSWLALVGGLVAMMLLVARMLFGPAH